MNSSYGKPNNNNNKKTGSTNAFDFDLGLSSGRSGQPLNAQKNPSYPSSSSSTYTYSSSSQPKPTSSWAHQPARPAWTHQPAGSSSGPTSMVGDIFGKSWGSSTPSNSGVGIVSGKNPNLFGDLLGSAMGQSKSSNVPLSKAGPGQGPFSMGGMGDSLPKTGTLGNGGGAWGASSSLGGGGNVGLGGNSNRNTNLGGKSMAGGGSGMGSKKDPFGSLVDFSTKPQGGMSKESKESGKSGLGNDSFGGFQNVAAFSSGVSEANPLDDFGFSNSQSQAPVQSSSGGSDFDVLFSGGGNKKSGGVVEQQFSGRDDWGMASEFGGGNDAGGSTTELEGLPPPPAGVSAPSAKSKGMENYKQGQFADAIKWLSWAVVLFEKAGDNDGSMEVLSCRASCYKEVGEYKKAVADCTKVLEHDKSNVSVLVQRALLYESMEKYKLGAEDLRTVMKIDPANRVARSTIHRLSKMAE